MSMVSHFKCFGGLITRPRKGSPGHSAFEHSGKFEY